MKEIYFREIMTFDDLIWTPFYIIVVIAGALFIRNLLYKSNDPIRVYFIPALVVKIVGGICVGLIYTFYYDGGDTTEFFDNAITFNAAFQESPVLFWRLLMNPALNNDPTLQQYRAWVYFLLDPPSYFTGKIAAVLNLFTFNNYSACAVLFAALSFSGVWALYVTFCKIYPNLYKQFALAVLFIPSVFFWGSGILKDCVTFGCVGWMTYFAYSIFFKGKNLILGSAGLIFSGYLIASIKPYILFAFVPSMLFWIFLYYRSRIRSALARAITGPIIFIMTIGLGIIVINKLGQQFTMYSFQGALQTSQGYQAWHEELSNTGQVGSGYNLGNIDGSFRSILIAMPLAVNVTLFRPYLWEAHNPVMLLSALESTVMLYLTLRLFFKTGIGKTFKTIGKNPHAFFCFFFAVFFGFCVGFTAYNFGALVRYKIPCIPFYVMGLFIMQYQTAEDRKEEKAKSDARRAAHFSQISGYNEAPQI